MHRKAIMNTYLPAELLQNFNKYYISEHASKDPVSNISRGIKILDKKDTFEEGYLYVGKPSDLKGMLSKYESFDKPFCIITSGKCDFFNEDFPIPDQLFLIETKLDLIPLYNSVQDYIKKFENQRPKKAGEIFVNQAFQTLILDILDSKMTEEEEIKEYLEQNNLDTSRYFRVYAVRFNTSTHTGSIAWNYIISSMQKVFPTAYIATYGDVIILLDKHANKKPDFRVNEEAIKPILSQYDGFFGVGNICGHLASIPAVYSQIMACIRYGSKTNPEDRIFYYEDYAMYQIVELALEAANRSMHTRNPIHLMNNESVALLEYDTKNNDDLLDVLDCYLLHDCNLKETSEALFIHRNTLRNKLEKIEEIMGLSLGNPKTEERLRFSCSTYRYIKNVLKEDPLKLRRNPEPSNN